MERFWSPQQGTGINNDAKKKTAWSYTITIQGEVTPSFHTQI